MGKKLTITVDVDSDRKEIVVRDDAGNIRRLTEKIPFRYLSDRGKQMVGEHTFEGIIPNLGRRYRETDSLMVREELAKYLNSKSCPECHGTRLRREARYVKVGEGDGARAIFEVSGLPLKEAAGHFGRLVLDGQKQAIAYRIIKEIVSRLAFLNNVGLDYLSLDRSAETLSGGERRSASGSPRRSVRG